MLDIIAMLSVWLVYFFGLIKSHWESKLITLKKYPIHHFALSGSKESVKIWQISHILVATETFLSKKKKQKIRFSVVNRNREKKIRVWINGRMRERKKTMIDAIEFQYGICKVYEPSHKKGQCKKALIQIHPY